MVASGATEHGPQSEAAAAADRARFRLSHAAQLHRTRRLALLTAQPELKALYGPHPGSYACILALIALHGSVAWCVRDASLGMVFLAALCVGQFLLHAGGALVHETAHGLIFSRRRGRLLVNMTLEVLLTSFGHHAQYQLDHIHSHHPYLGDYARDYEHKDACRFWARRDLQRSRPTTHRALIALHLLLDGLPLGFLISDDLVEACERRLCRLPLRDGTRHVPGPSLSREGRLLYGLLSASVLVLLGVALGPKAVLYAVWSLSIFQGRWALSNVGQVLSEHSATDAARPTQSYYGLWNLVLFNTGYHDEHHTFPQVAWNRLPRLRARAPEAFGNESPRGYLGFWFAYVFQGVPRRPSAALALAEARCRAGK